MATFVSSRRCEFLTLEADLPGRAPQTIGVLLYDPADKRLGARLRRDWDRIAEPEEEEVLEALAADLDDKSQEMGAEALLEYLETTLSNTVRISDRQAVLSVDFDATLNRLYREQVPAAVIPFRTHLPLYSLRAAAGRWGDQAPVEEEDWIETPADLRLTEDMFVARVVGRSMEPLISDGSLCVFRSGVVGSRQGKRVLVENFAESDQGGQRYTVKRYTSLKRQLPAAGEEDAAWEHARIRLEPLNPEYEPWEIVEGSDCRVLAEFVRVLE